MLAADKLGVEEPIVWESKTKVELHMELKLLVQLAEEQNYAGNVARRAIVQLPGVEG